MAYLLILLQSVYSHMFDPLHFHNQFPASFQVYSDEDNMQTDPQNTISFTEIVLH